MQAEAAACYRAGPGPSSALFSSISSSNRAHQCRRRARALHALPLMQLHVGNVSGCCWSLQSAPCSSHHTSHSSREPQKPPGRQKRSQRDAVAACAVHSTAARVRVCRTGCSRHGTDPLQHSLLHSSTRQCIGNPWIPSISRSVQAHGASLALAEPTTAATVASAAVAVGSFSFSKVLAVVLGWAVLIGSLFRSVPQIMKVLQHQSTEGLSLTSYIVELCCYSISIAYNISQGYGFNTFGEVVACWLQDIILIGLIFRFSRTKKWVAAATGGAVALGCVWLLSPCCPLQVLAVLQASNIITMALGSRLPQIILNMRRGNAGVLSVMTCILNVAGNTARIFTTVVLTGDMLLMAGYLSQGTLNTILLCQSIGTARQKRRAESSSDSSSSKSSVPGHQQQQQEVAEPLQLGPDPGLGGHGGLVMQPAT